MLNCFLELFDWYQVYQKFLQASQTMWATLKCAEVWRPCTYMFVSLALSLNIQEGMFYWYTDTTSGLSFSEVRCLLHPLSVNLAAVI